MDRVKRKRIVWLTFLTLGVLLTLQVLYLKSPLSHKLYRGNFDRVFLADSSLRLLSVVNLPYNSYYIAGAARNHVYLGNWTGPLNMIAVNSISSDTAHVQFKGISLDALLDVEKYRLRVDSPFFFLANGEEPGLLRGTLATGIATDLMTGEYYFDDVLPLGKSSFAFRSYSATEKGFQLAKFQVDSPRFQFKDGVLQKQIDGLLCVQGKIQYSKKSGKLVYLYSYRNEYIVMDTLLNIQYRGNTIDSFSRVPISVAQLGSGNRSVLASPPTVVNSYCSIDGDDLYVKSNVMARNEVEEEFVGGSVIDVYDMTKGVYRHSFHVPNYHGKRLREFKASQDWFAGLYERELIFYRLRPVCFDEGEVE